MTAQYAHADGVEGAEPQALGAGADQPLDPLEHLPRRLVGEGDGKDLAGKRPPGRQDMGKAGDQHPGLAGAGAGQDQNRPVERLHRRALLLVQRLEIRIIA